MRDKGRVAIYPVMTALCAVLLADTALAQDALLVGGRFYSASRDFGQDLGPAPLVRQSDIFGGGRYAVLGRDVVDGRTGAVFSVFGNILAADQARPRVFVRRESGVWQVDVANNTEVPMWLGDGTLVRHCAFAYSTDVLFCGLRRNDGLVDVVAIDAATSVAKTITAIAPFLPQFSSDEPAWIVTSDGRRLYFGQAAGPNEAVLAALDTSTGIITTSTAPVRVDPGFNFTKVVVDEANERLIVIRGGAITALSKDLAVLGTTSIGASPGQFAFDCTNLVVSPHSRRLYLGLWYDRIGAGIPTTLSVFDATTYAALASSSEIARGPQIGNPCSYMAVLTAPGAPKDLTAAVLGNHALLTWTNVGGASAFALDVGFAPGRTDLTLSLGPDAFVTFLNVPSGTYYLRLRGRNEYGGGRPSSEIKFVVP